MTRVLDIQNGLIDVKPLVSIVDIQPMMIQPEATEMGWIGMLLEWTEVWQNIWFNREAPPLQANMRSRLDCIFRGSDLPIQSFTAWH